MQPQRHKGRNRQSDVLVFAKRSHSGSWCSSCLCGSPRKLPNEAIASRSSKLQVQGSTFSKITKRTQTARAPCGFLYIAAQRQMGTRVTCPSNFLPNEAIPDIRVPWCSFVVQTGFYETNPTSGRKAKGRRGAGEKGGIGQVRRAIFTKRTHHP